MSVSTENAWENIWEIIWENKWKERIKITHEKNKKNLESFAKFYYKLPNIRADSKWQNMRRSQFLI